jgi:hypothetical protein
MAVDEIANVVVGTACFWREVHKGCDAMYCLWWDEGNLRGQAWSRAQDIGHVVSE